jgi:glycosyltransferase involved in cell wall biosynthesis
MQALALIDSESPDWKYVCKVWPQPRTKQQNLMDLQLATQLGIEKKVTYTTNVISRNFIPYLLAACDIYAAPSRLEGFGMIQVEANACGKPVVGIRAMGMLDTMVHRKTAYLARVAQEIRLRETTVEDGSGNGSKHHFVFKRPRIVDYRASIQEIAEYLLELMQDAGLRSRMGEAGRKRVTKNFGHRLVAKKFVQIISEKLGVS